MNDNNNDTENKITDMRTRIEKRYDDRPTHHLTGHRTMNLSVDFYPGRSSVLPVHIVATREYLRDLRAAELRDWERSGGDFLAS
jgi:hypothetical protein